MDTEILNQFARLENALNTLIDSITSYNPSPAAAIDLVVADDELSEGLSQCASNPSPTCKNAYMADREQWQLTKQITLVSVSCARHLKGSMNRPRTL